MNFINQKKERNISKDVKMLISGVQTLIKKWKMIGSVDTKPRSDRPTKISSQLPGKLFRMQRKGKNPQLS